MLDNSIPKADDIICPDNFVAVLSKYGWNEMVLADNDDLHAKLIDGLKFFQ